MKAVVALFFGAAFGFLLGIWFAALSLTKANIVSSISCDCGNIVNQTRDISIIHARKEAAFQTRKIISESISDQIKTQKTWTNATDLTSKPSKKKEGLEKLPPKIVANESDLFLRRLWGKPSEDLLYIPKYLVTFTVGIKQKKHINECVKKFSDNFTILLFHYDGKTNEWDEFEWSKKVIHVSAHKQTKWWYAKRFLHPSIVAPYDYIFIWDEDLGLEHFNAEEYIRLVKKHGLEISQPGLDPSGGYTWEMTKRKADHEAHKIADENSSRCSNPPRPPCAAFVEIMAPVFSQEAWKCVWHLIQNDLVHGWGLDFALHKCVEPPHEKIGVVDAQYIHHNSVPSLGDQGQANYGQAPWQGVRDRCMREWKLFQSRLEIAEKEKGEVDPTYSYQPH